MESIKDILKFCNNALCYDYENIGFVDEINQVRKFIINNFKNTIPHLSIIDTLSLIDDITLKIHNNNFEDVIENIHELRESLLYMLSFDKLIKDNDGKLI